MPPSPASLACSALLFDLDGVLVDSTACIERTWREWAARHALDADAVLRLAHGRRALETVRRAAPHLDDTEVAAEAAALAAHEARETTGVLEVPGAAALLRGLPPERWAVVTSGVRAVAEHRLRHVGLPIPPIMVCADEVAHGKPHPEGYLAAAARLGFAAAECVVVEDAPAGLAAARAAGVQALAVATTHAPADLADARLVAPTLRAVAVRVERSGGGAVLRVELREATAGGAGGAETSVSAAP
ncbi:HAD-IA family hydrolase [Roseisolibacter sp. H3M3-2]|uniref:HAD-IA family hydrolase n=1 Tax=Roseisolibacter sp. H3M3-2 TaxID=3031323 RepID=UPI0023DC4E65|nr:HAD-IA family hydrolase [Roseisolibacter sp. H3M3-2]MDF1502743.1 HAD-IA family hydrolase [Roseisolibacter sp. H3M3-2]